MGILYHLEHLSCIHYVTKSKPVIDIIRIDEGESLDIEVVETILLILTEGAISLSYEKTINQPISESCLMIFPAGVNLNLVAHKHTIALAFHIRQGIDLCENYTIQKLLDETKIKDDTKSEDSFYSLSVNSNLGHYINSLTQSINDGAKCRHYMEIKTKELFFLLRLYYHKEELAKFLRPLMSKDAYFTDFVWKNYRKARNVTQLAEMSNYSLSAFKDKFRKIFGMSATEWLTEQKIRNLYHELHKPNKSIKQISSEYHFSSESHLNTFCREKFGETPGQIRKNGQQTRSEE